MARFALLALTAATFCAAATPPAISPAMLPADTPSAAYPRKIPAPGGHVLIPNERAQRSYDELKYAPARRVGDVLYISGVVAGPLGEEGRDAAALTLQLRRAFRRIQDMLNAEGLTFADVALINSFHVWHGPAFTGQRAEQFKLMSAVKDEFMGAPHAAWTAVGTDGLLAADAVVEIQVIAHAPRGRQSE
jgi:enamine deaminase RidA (YjgF/YER057c/UK114 family)